VAVPQFLERMRRGYSREAYLELISRMKEIIPGCTVTSDFITGFCGETEEEHKDTLSLFNIVKYEQAFMFAYSLREKTHAHRNYTDDVPIETKQRRLKEVVDTFKRNAGENCVKELHKEYLVLVEGPSKKTDLDFSGRTDTNKVVNFPRVPVAVDLRPENINNKVAFKPGDYIVVKIEETFPHSLKGTPIAKTSMEEYLRKEIRI